MIHLENVLKISLQDVLKMSWRRLQNVLKTSWRCLEDVFARRLEDVLKTSWRHLGKTSWRRLEDVLKTSWRRLEDIWPRRIYWSWPRRLKDVFWRRKAKANIFVLMKTSSSRQMFAGNQPSTMKLFPKIVNIFKPLFLQNLSLRFLSTYYVRFWNYLWRSLFIAKLQAFRPKFY